MTNDTDNNKQKRNITNNKRNNKYSIEVHTYVNKNHGRINIED